MQASCTRRDLGSTRASCVQILLAMCCSPRRRPVIVLYPEVALLPHLHLFAVVSGFVLYHGPGWVVTRTPSRRQGSASEGANMSDTTGRFISANVA